MANDPPPKSQRHRLMMEELERRERLALGVAGDPDGPPTDVVPSRPVMISFFSTGVPEEATEPISLARAIKRLKQAQRRVLSAVRCGSKPGSFHGADVLTGLAFAFADSLIKPFLDDPTLKSFSRIQSNDPQFRSVSENTNRLFLVFEKDDIIVESVVDLVPNSAPSGDEQSTVQHVPESPLPGLDIDASLPEDKLLDQLQTGIEAIDTRRQALLEQIAGLDEHERSFVVGTKEAADLSWAGLARALNQPYATVQRRYDPELRAKYNESSRIHQAKARKAAKAAQTDTPE